MIWSEQIIHFLTLLGGSVRFRVTGIFSAGKSPRLLEAKKGPVRSCDVRWRSSKELYSPPPPPSLTTQHPSWMETPPPPLPPPPAPCAPISLTADTIPLTNQRGVAGLYIRKWSEGDSFFCPVIQPLVSLNTVRSLFLYTGGAHSGRKRALVARAQWRSLRLSFGPYAPNGWCNEVCKTSLSLHVFGLVPVIGCVKKCEGGMTRMRL